MAVGGKIEDGGWDPYRVIDTNKFCTLHTDNAYSNPRPPDYVGLMCLSNAAVGGESLLMSAYTLHNQILDQHPEYLERLYQDFSWDTPPLQTLPDGPPTKKMPIFEIKDEELVIHYLDLYLEPGMKRAGTPMTIEEKEMQVFLDAQMLRDELMFRYLMHPGKSCSSTIVGIFTAGRPLRTAWSGVASWYGYGCGDDTLGSALIQWPLTPPNSDLYRVGGGPRNSCPLYVAISNWLTPTFG